MYKVQERLGKLFFILSLALLFIKIGACVFEGKYEALSNPWSWIYVILPILFGVTFLIKNKITKILQVVVIGLLACGSLYTTINNPFWGLSLLIVVFLVCFTYGWFKTNYVIKYISLNICFCGIFYGLLRNSFSEALLYAIEWVLFIDGFLLIIWYTFKDWLDRMRQTDSEERHRCIEIIKEANKTSREAMEVATIAINTMERFEDSIKKGEPNGK
jgi:hypothetical protein